jgi:hypothetical protein
VERALQRRERMPRAAAFPSVSVGWFEGEGRCVGSMDGVGWRGTGGHGMSVMDCARSSPRRSRPPRALSSHLTPSHRSCALRARSACTSVPRAAVGRGIVVAWGAAGASGARGPRRRADVLGGEEWMGQTGRVACAGGCWKGLPCIAARRRWRRCLFVGCMVAGGRRDIGSGGEGGVGL